jgi:predicted 3-demethylubiquinone-9 3-methyltransferase (glyoxalase superfamily)
MASIQKITPNLWFDSQAEEAAKFYVSIFKNSSIGKTSRYGKEGFEIHKQPEGKVMTIEFTLDGQKFTALNGGPIFKFTEAVSFVINCKDQEEIDYFWEKLGAGGDPRAQQCGWLKDKFGLSWQVVPEMMGKLFSDSTSGSAQRAMKAMLQMKKLDIATLEKAAKGE